MSWLGSHPYTTSSLGAGLLLVIGASIVVTHTGVVPTTASHTESWGSNNAFFAAPRPSPPPSAQYTDSPTPTITNPVEAAYVSPFATNTIPLSSNDNSPVDLDTLLATLSHPSTQTTVSGTKGTDSYDLIPSGLISVSNLSPQVPNTSETAVQKSLRDYADAAGTAITSFENQHHDQANILKDHAEAPYDSLKVQALARLGTDYKTLGDTLSQIDPVPAQIATFHKKIVGDYRDLGSRLVVVSHSPDDLYNAIVAYDASADQFAKDFVSLALTFPAYNVRFSQGDGGSVFQFSGNAGL